MEGFRYREYDFLYHPLLDKNNKEVIIKIKGNPQGNDILFRDVIQSLEPLEYIADKGIFREIDIEFIRWQGDDTWFEEWTVRKENVGNKYMIEFIRNSTIGGTGVIIRGN